jgi:hypothetical protein
LNAGFIHKCLCIKKKAETAGRPLSFGYLLNRTQGPGLGQMQAGSFALKYLWLLFLLGKSFILVEFCR